MSLKAFHLVFIVASILLAIGFGVWSFMNYSAPHGRTSDLVAAIVSAVVALALVGKEIYFLRKLKNVSYL
jgi:hypothetical protein